jgi:putative ABC transport system permease protein
MDALRQDLRFAGRALRKSPGFTITAMLALALGIGGNSAIFSIADALILKPPPFAHADRLVVFWRENAQQGARYNEVAPSDIRAVRERSKAFEALAAWDFRGAVLTGNDQPERLQGLAVDANLFPMLGVSPVVGRGFTEAEDRDGAAPVAIISHGLWERRFAGDQGVLGRSILLNGTPTTVIGVMPANFHFAVNTDVWRPLALSESDWQNTDGWLRTVGRLRPGVTPASASRELDAIATALERERPGAMPGWRFSLFRINEGLAQGPMKPMVLILLGAVGFVLLIACADVANLLLARASGRARDTAIRTALGASRGRLVRQLLTESLMLSVGGAIIGIVFAWWALDMVRAALPAMILEFAPRLATLSVDARVLVYTGAIALASALIFGLAPAWRGSRPDLTGVLKEAERGSTAGPRRQRLRATLVGFQVAVALVLLAGAGITMRSFLAQQNANPGFRSNNLLAMWVSPSQAAYPEPEQLRTFQGAITERIGALPDVEAVALSNAYPLSGEDARWPFSVDGRPAEEEQLTTAIRMVTPGYLRVLGVTFHSGRDFEAADGPDGRPVTIASESFVRRFFPGEDPIGKRITLEGDSSREIIGVVSDVQDWKTASTSMAMLYTPMSQLAQRTVAIVVRTRRDPATSADAIRRAVYSVDANVPVYGIRTMSDVVDDAVFNQRLASSMMAVFSVIALLLAVIGVYGVMAFAVSQRTHELGIRMALGARAHNVTRDVVTQGMRPVCLGVAFGIAGALGMARLLERILFDAGGPEIVPLGGAAVVLVLAALLAIALPVWRATRVDPMIALRNE